MFWRKKKSIVAVELSDRRDHYRKSPSKSQGLSLSIQLENGNQVAGDLLDLTIQGAGVRFLASELPDFQVGDVVRISIGPLQKPAVETPARIVNMRRSERRFMMIGLQYVNAGGLYSQLDEFYMSAFNRRRHERVRPQLDRKVPVTISTVDGEVKGSLHDLSESGAGAILDTEHAEGLIEGQTVQLSFRIPDHEEPLQGPASVRHRTPLESKVLLGLEFDPDNGSFGARKEELREYVAVRKEAIARWEAQWAS